MSIERPSTLDFPPEAEGMDQVYCRPDTLTDVPFHYCPGCAHSVVHRVLMEVIQELDIQDKTWCRCKSYDIIIQPWNKFDAGRTFLYCFCTTSMSCC